MKRTASISVRPDLLSVVGVFAAVLLALSLASPAQTTVVIVFCACLVLGLVFWLPPHLFLGGTLAVLASSSAFEQHFISVGGSKVYTLDIVIPLILLRAALPRERRPTQLSAFDSSVAIPVALGALIMFVAGLRGSLAGNTLGAVARLETPLVYVPLAYWGFTRILGEVAVSIPRVVRALVVTSLAFIGYAAVARLTHHRFGAPSGSGIGGVETTAGLLRRDYGFFSAFQLYALLALGGLSYLFFSRRAALSAYLVTAVGVAATLLTLVRGLIFGIVVGALWLFVLSRKTRRPVRLGWRILPLVAVGTVAAILFATFSPVAARGVTERLLPGVLTQSSLADANTEYRIKALQAGEHVAWNAPFGLGFVQPQALDTAGYPPIYIPHSQWGSLLVFTGWPGVIALGWAALALLRRSARLPAAVPWLHPLVAATVLLVVVQGSGWDVLFSQTWSLGMIALVLALRFGLRTP